jgi:hypothetical protein
METQILLMLKLLLTLNKINKDFIKLMDTKGKVPLWLLTSSRSSGRKEPKSQRKARTSLPYASGAMALKRQNFSYPYCNGLSEVKTGVNTF